MKRKSLIDFNFTNYFFIITILSSDGYDKKYKFNHYDVAFLILKIKFCENSQKINFTQFASLFRCILRKVSNKHKRKSSV